MKRNMDLIRAILFKIEEDEHGFAPKIELDGYTQEEIGYHSVLIGEAGLAVVSDLTHGGAKSPVGLIIRLTWAGHEFLDSVREQTIWNQVKEKVAKIGGATLPIWLALATELIKKQLGM